MTPAELYQAGQLDDAIEAAIQEVKKQPTNMPSRFFLAELLCFAGDLERADRQLETVVHQTTEAAMLVSLFRQLIRAEISRQQFYQDGRLPEFLFQPTDALRLYLDASIAMREGNLAEANDIFSRAESQRPQLSGTCDGKAFDDFRDLDDRTAGFLEVLTCNGTYYWIPIENLERVELQPPARPLDLIWRTAQISVAGGPDGNVYLPVLYQGTTDRGDDQLKLGRGTDWVGGDNAPVQGLGQRMFLVGEDARPVLQIGVLEFNPASEG